MDNTNKSESSVTLVSKLDASDPLYLHASDSSGLTVVNVKLKGTENYVVWSNAMHLALMAKNKLGFIDESCKRSTTDDVLASQWDRCNSIVLTWILNSVSDELYVGQVYSKLASEVWDDLKETYNKIDGSVVFGLFQKINSVSQNGASVSEYYHKINTMWKQFDAMLQLPSCTCQASTKFNEFNHLIKLMQFLMGLDGVYQPVRTNLLTRDPLPTVKTAFSIISREESHRDSNSSSKVPNVGFAAKTNQFNENKKRFTKGSNPNLKCTHCNKIGHVVDKCFELHGCPSNFRPRPNQNNNQWSKPNISANSSINSTVNHSVSDKSASNSLNSLTSDQFTKLLDLLNEKKTDDGPKTNVGGKCHNVISSLDCYKRSYCFNSKSWSQNNMSWIIDSGANQHMIMSSENMFNKVDVSDYNITVKHPNSEKMIEFDQSPTDDSGDEEEEKHINVAKTYLSPESFQFYFADRLEKLKERQAAKEQKKKKCESVDQEKNSEHSEEVKFAEQVVEEEKVIEAEKVVEVEKIIEVEKIVEIIKPCLKCLESCKLCEEKDEKLAEFEKMKEQLLFNLNYVKESYDVLNRTVTGLQKTNSEREDALTMMNAVMMSKQKAINHYIEECAKLKLELETEKIENERIRRLLQSYSSSDYLIYRIYPTVAGFEAFQNDEKPKKKDSGKKQSVSYNKCPPPI
ncbi:putative transcription factor interactor and regulator CCHC(Zn) family [Helianthus annuus]|uniref:Transcription factor interactor and regulator CCHC(Zn) family n=1 Tax=Helianthus annuus TaxID=4232 RepID=A0A9K3HB71_HELAN|nr:putative transcription factor interactor and regulator CCHC(Zn) family [Helianthus annuus]